jgi:sialidase-1
VWLLFCSNLKEDQEWQIHARQGRDSEGRRVWLASSADLGKSWSSPREITAQVKRPGWTWYATGPGAGVQLESGRLLLPCNHAEDVEEHEHPYLVSWGRSRMVAHCVYSDDHGRSWHVGGVAAKHTNEAALAKRADGSVPTLTRTRALTLTLATRADGSVLWLGLGYGLGYGLGLRLGLACRRLGAVWHLRKQL